MNRLFVDPPALRAFLTRLDASFGRPGRLYLVGETTLLFEGWRAWTDAVEFTAEVEPADRPAFAEAVRRARAEADVDVLEESPADVIPLPDGYAGRARPAGFSAAAGDGAPGGAAEARWLAWCHFDPYSVAFRYLARGDERDYRLILTLLTHGWLTLDEMDRLLDGLLPRFSFQTIQQDPAEFRRRYKGLMQMWRAVSS
jgi:hypothetical protein